MIRLSTSLFIITTLITTAGFSQNTTHFVSSQSEFDVAVEMATTGDSIVWRSGAYDDIFMNIDKDGLIVTAEESGKVIMAGSSKVEIPSNDITLSGIQFLGGDIGTDHVIQIDGSDMLVTQINIKDYTSYKYLIIDELSQRNTVSYCNFENRINLDDQNILSILVDDTNPGYHKIQYCSFKHFEGTGNDMGIEPIRIGLSTQSEFRSRTIVEYCYFTQCDGDGELISNKAAQNVFRYNTFENNSKAELVLRHGDEGIVYGNFFINNMGGVRVREGQGHFIYNNYFTGIDRRPIYLQNEASDPLEDIHIYFNTIVNSAKVILGGNGDSNPPKNVVLANNIFAFPVDKLFEEATGTETWIANISDGTLGITRPGGITEVDPQLELNSEGFYQLGSGSPAIEAAEAGYPVVPTFDGIEFDNEILMDLMKQSRPEPINLKDIGASEYSTTTAILPHANENNTGPAYLSEKEIFIVTTTAVGNGSISLDPASGVYFDGTSVTVTAIPNGNNDFTSWSGALNGTENPQTIIVDQNLEITATFTAVTNLENETGDQGLMIFPNPSEYQINLEMNLNRKSSIKFDIYSASGIRTELHGTQELLKGVYTLTKDISSLSPGMYFIQLQQYDQEQELISSVRLKFMKY